MIQIDFAYHLNEHITQQSVSEFVEEIFGDECTFEHAVSVNPTVVAPRFRSRQLGNDGSSDLTWQDVPNSLEMMRTHDTNEKMNDLYDRIGSLEARLSFHIEKNLDNVQEAHELSQKIEVLEDKMMWAEEKFSVLADRIDSPSISAATMCVKHDEIAERTHNLETVMSEALLPMHSQVGMLSEKLAELANVVTFKNEQKSKDDEMLPGPGDGGQTIGQLIRAGALRRGIRICAIQGDSVSLRGMDGKDYQTAGKSLRASRFVDGSFIFADSAESPKLDRNGKPVFGKMTDGKQLFNFF